MVGRGPRTVHEQAKAFGESVRELIERMRSDAVSSQEGSRSRSRWRAAVWLRLGQAATLLDSGTQRLSSPRHRKKCKYRSRGKSIRRMSWNSDPAHRARSWISKRGARSLFGVDASKVNTGCFDESRSNVHSRKAGRVGEKLSRPTRRSIEPPRLDRPPRSRLVRRPF